ncbi:alpha/beta fold hydrolase [Actinoplanes sp. NPDC048988]|uniref:alpha/beta hydrolase n=1 Tax=Actinoplanes sp. NPDC048988 TaxID=3363901 RepID=UPI00371C361A
MLKKRRWLLLLLTLLVLAPIVAVAVERIQVAVGRAAHPMPGQLVDVGGHRLHLIRQGSGGPTVVLEAGSGEAASSWQTVADSLAPQTTVVRYDRAGYAWSEAADTARTGEHVTAELHAALAAVNAPKPYVLVGHSLGGLYAREFAQRYPADVEGLVLVDARPEDDARRTAPLLSGGTPATALPPWILASLKAVGALRAGGGALLDGLVPPDQRREFLDVTAAPWSYFATKQREADLIHLTEDAVRGQNLQDLPVRVIARGRPQDYEAAGIDAATGAELERIWQDGQRRQLTISRRAKLMVAERSGHLVPLEQPGIIVEVAREVIAEASASR